MTVMENLTSSVLYDGTGTVTVAAAISATSQPCAEVMVQADPDNSVALFVGNATSQSTQLAAGQAATIPVDNPTKVYARSADGVTAARFNYLARG